MGQFQQFLQILSENSAGLVVLAALVSAVSTLVIAWFSIGMASTVSYTHLTLPTIRRGCSARGWAWH